MIFPKKEYKNSSYSFWFYFYMSHIYLLRHAKAQEDFEKDDFDRKLCEKWKKQVKKLLNILKEKDIKFDSIFASPAKRCKQTAELIGQKTGKTKNSITYDSDLYLCGRQYLCEKIKLLKKHGKWNILIVAHNPAIEDTINMLSNNEVGHVKTCEIIQIQ